VEWHEEGKGAMVDGALAGAQRQHNLEVHAATSLFECAHVHRTERADRGDLEWWWWCFTSRVIVLPVRVLTKICMAALPTRRPHTDNGEGKMGEEGGRRVVSSSGCGDLSVCAPVCVCMCARA
jgi:hypothetical protein